MEFRKEFPAEDEMVVVVESEDAEKSRRFVDRLGAKLEAETNLFAGVHYKGDLKRLGRKALLFLEENELAELAGMLGDYLPFLEKFTQANNLVSLFNQVNAQIARAQRGTNAATQSLLKALPALKRIVTLAADGLQRAGNPPSPGVSALFEGDTQGRQYLTFADGRIHLVTAQARQRSLTKDAIVRLRELLADAQQEVPGLNVGLTGEPILEYDEMNQSKRDTLLASVISLVAVALIFIYGYHETGRPLKATFCLLIGLGYTMGFTTLVVGHLNILTITFVPILVGLAIDFGVHLITRYEEELRHGRSEKVALEKAMVNTGMGVFTGALTTAAAFFAMAFTDFDGIQEMGLICGGGMLVCLVPMMTLLPALLIGGQQNVLDHQMGAALESRAKAEVARRERIESLWLARPVTVIAVVAALCVAAAVVGRHVRFDYNLLHMQSAGLPAVLFQDKLIQSSSMSVLYAVLPADSPEQANALTARLTNLPVVASVLSMGKYLADDSTNKLPRLRQVKALARQLDFRPADPDPVNVPELTQAVWSLHGYLGLALAEVKAAEDAKLRHDLTTLREAIAGLLHRLRTDNRPDVVSKLTAYQQALFEDLRQTFATLQQQDDTGHLRAADLPANLRQRFIGRTGRQLLQVFPKKDIWEHAEQKEFIEALRTVDPKVTGAPVQLLEYTTLLKQSYQEAALYSLLAIAVMVFIHFRRISCVLLGLVPVLFGSLWLVGLMVALGLPFNPANIMTLPLMVGIGVTNGIHILNRFAEELHPSILARSTGKAVLVSGLTTIAGFGSLILAQHRGIRSLGCIMSIGVASCMVVGLTLLPAILNLLSQRGWTIRRKKRTQRDNAQSTLGREEPRS
jgi:hopanoid biosynthesis associated RND transporter like protein HpnN